MVIFRVRLMVGVRVRVRFGLPFLAHDRHVVLP
jgi:hypothetical protein